MRLNRILSYLFVGALAMGFSACEDMDDYDSRMPQSSETPGGEAPESVVTDAFVKGADVSWLTEMEVNNKKFYDAEGTEMECMSLLKSLGTNAVRLRVWVNPVDGWCSKMDVLAKAMRANRLGLRIMIDFHYSDVWADPANQIVPTAWAEYSYEDMKKAVAAHTTDVLSALKAWDITPEWVQVGNETRSGMLGEMGSASSNPAQYAGLHNAGYDAVKAIFPEAKVIVHVDNGYDTARNWLFKSLKDNGGKFDMIGLSHYPWSAVDDGKCTDWKDCNDKLITNIQTLANAYSVDVMVVEFGYPASEAATAKDCLQDLMTQGSAISCCAGVMYWEPQSYDWKSYGNGAFSTDGKPTIALDPFKSIYRQQ